MSREVKVGNEWVRVAGRGKAEYGASHYQTGTVVITAKDASYGTYGVTFSEPMPDTDYIVVLEINGLWGSSWHTKTFNVAYDNKTVNGFMICVGKPNGTVIEAGVTVKWLAFKLYSDKEYDGLLDDVAEMKTYDGSTTGTLAMSTRTGQSISTNKCVLIAKDMWFVDFSLTCTDSFTGVDYTLGQMPLGTLTINGKSVYGVLSGKLYGSAYTDDSTAVTVTMPATCHPSQGWIFFGRQQGLAGVSSSSKFKTLGTNINRFAGILYATA